MTKKTIKGTVDLSRESLDKLPELSDLSNFPTYEAFAIYIGNILRDKNNTKNPQTAERIFKALHEKTDFNTN